jgi:hypothetical protein
LYWIRRETGREIEREKEMERGRETKREIERLRERDGERKRDREIEKQRERAEQSWVAQLVLDKK